MTAPNWGMIFSEFKAEMISQKPSSFKQMYAARSLANFLEAGSHIYLRKDLLLEWLKERLTLHTLVNTFVALYDSREFILFLEARGLCVSGVWWKLWENRLLFEQLEFPRHYCNSRIHLETHWQEVLASFERSLRGCSSLYIASTLHTASIFALFLQQRGIISPDEGIFVEWLDWKLSVCQLQRIVWLLPRVDRFCQFLIERGGCPLNPVRKWRQGQPRLIEALKLRREGKPPLFRPSKFQSFLKCMVEAFIVHKRSLGRKYRELYVLENFDRYVKAHKIDKLSEINGAILHDFLGTVSHWKSSTRKECIGQLKHFFHFLERRGEITSEHNPARFLPHIVRHRYIPHIFTIKELVIILSELRENSGRCGFDGAMVFTFFHLIYACGLRISEAIRLQVQDVNLKERTIFIRNTKFGKDRLIPFGYRAGEYLANYIRVRFERFGKPEETGPFFISSTSRPYCRTQFELIFRSACRRTGVGQQGAQGPRPHDLRHSFAVHRLYKWYQEGADPVERLVLLSIYMGHVKPEYTQHYLHIGEDLMRIAGRPLEQSLDEWINERQVLQSYE